MFKYGRETKVANSDDTFYDLHTTTPTIKLLKEQKRQLIYSHNPFMHENLSLMLYYPDDATTFCSSSGNVLFAFSCSTN